MVDLELRRAFAHRARHFHCDEMTGHFDARRCLELRGFGAKVLDAFSEGRGWQEDLERLKIKMHLQTMH